MPEVIPVTSDTVDRLPADLPRMVRLALGDESLSLRFCLAPHPRRRHRHCRSLFTRRMGHARPDPISLPVLRESGLDAVDADRQANGASHAGGPALAQPQYETPGSSQHLQTLRYRKRLLFGVARPGHDLFVGAV